jgi:hypothetical protein
MFQKLSFSLGNYSLDNVVSYKKYFSFQSYPKTEKVLILFWTPLINDLMFFTLKGKT